MSLSKLLHQKKNNFLLLCLLKTLHIIHNRPESINHVCGNIWPSPAIIPRWGLSLALTEYGVLKFWIVFPQIRAGYFQVANPQSCMFNILFSLWGAADGKMHIYKPSKKNNLSRLLCLTICVVKHQYALVMLLIVKKSLSVVLYADPLNSCAICLRILSGCIKLHFVHQDRILS